MDSLGGPQPAVKNEPRNKKARVAVVAVHGVGNQSPGESARQTSDLLANLESAYPSGCVHYTAFEKESIAIAVEPVKILSGSTPALPSKEFRIFGPFNSMAMDFAEKAQHAHGANREPQDRATLDRKDEQSYRFMLGQLKDYKIQSAERTYRSVRLRGIRSSTDQNTDVDIYELYWKDLSSLGLGVATLLGEFYQLLFHLTSLGCQAIRGTLIENPTFRQWRRFTKLQNWASLGLSIAIPILNLLLLVIVLDLIVCSTVLGIGEDQLGVGYTQLRGFVAFIVGSIVLLACVATLLLRKPIRLGQPVWWLSIIAFAILLISGVLLVQLRSSLLRFFSGETGSIAANVVFPTIVLVPLASLFASILTAYDRQRPGVSKLTCPGVLLLVLGPLSALVFAECTTQVSATNFGVPVLVGVITLLKHLLEVAWLGFFVLLSCAHVAGRIALNDIPAVDDRNKRARLSRWTARFTLSVSGLVVFVVTFALWTLVAVGMSKVCNPRYLGEQPAMLLSLRWGNALCLLFLLVALIVATLDAWSLAPSAWSDVFPSAGPEKPCRADRKSRAMGIWMTNGNLLILWSGRLLYIAVFLVFPLAVLLFMKSFLPTEVRTPLENAVDWAQQSKYSAVILAGSATGFLALGGRISRIALAFRPALSIVLEIDSYFREHPLESNPRARIAARYVSLLRHLCADSEADAENYDAIVIIAHSQGSAITSDLLRFIRAGGSFRACDSKLERLDGPCPIYLFTMGSPLRQYYARLFPDLYKWMGSGAGSPVRPIPCDAPPNPMELGLANWTNAFRSGDYVGRQLWLNNDYAKLFDGTVRALCGRPDACFSRPREFCIGKGGHMHYWDSTAGPIAIELDQLIDLAACRPARVVCASSKSDPA